MSLITRESSNLVTFRRAVFSACERYRYFLLIRWALGPLLNLLALNPSKADEKKNDPTVARGVERAIRLGFAGLIVSNLFAWKSTDPKGMLTAAEPIGEHNDRFILEAAEQSQLIICAWGKNGNHLGRADAVYRMLPEHKLAALKITTGEPHHPLYLSYDLKPFAYRRGRKAA